MKMKKAIAELDSIHERMTKLVQPLDDQAFAQRPDEDQWSVAEVLHHLCIVERAVLQQLEASLDHPLPEVSRWKKFLPLKFLVGNRVRRVKAPKRVEPLNPPPREEVMENYDRARAATKEFGLRNEERLEHVGFKHPFLGDITGVGAISFVGYHEMRHHKQVQEIIAKVRR